MYSIIISFQILTVFFWSSLLSRAHVLPVEKYYTKNPTESAVRMVTNELLTSQQNGDVETTTTLVNLKSINVSSAEVIEENSRDVDTTVDNFLTNEPVFEEEITRPNDETVKEFNESVDGFDSTSTIYTDVIDFASSTTKTPSTDVQPSLNFVSSTSQYLSTDASATTKLDDADNISIVSLVDTEYDSENSTDLDEEYESEDNTTSVDRSILYTLPKDTISSTSTRAPDNFGKTIFDDSYEITSTSSLSSTLSSTFTTVGDSNKQNEIGSNQTTRIIVNKGSSRSLYSIFIYVSMSLIFRYCS